MMMRMKTTIMMKRMIMMMKRMIMMMKKEQVGAGANLGFAPAHFGEGSKKPIKQLLVKRKTPVGRYY